MVDKYGTHFLDDISLGAKVEFIYQAKTVNPNRTLTALQGMNSGYDRIFYNLPTAYDPDAIPENYAERTYYRSWGGAPAKAMYGLVSNKYGFKKEDFSSWQSSVSNNNLVLVEFGTGHNMVPLYGLIADSAKKEEVRKYIEKDYLKELITIYLTDLS